MQREALQKLAERRFDLSKCFIQCETSAQMIFASQPDIFHRILFGGVGCKTANRHQPIVFAQTLIDLGQELFQLVVAMIGGAIPQQEQLFAGIKLPEPLNIGHGVVPIARLKGF